MTNGKREVTEGQKVDRELKQTELGALIAKYRIHVFSLLVVIVLGIIGGGLYFQHKSKVDLSIGDMIFNFEDSSLKKFKDDKMSSQELITASEQLLKATKSHDGVASVLLKTADVLIEKGKLEDALKILETVKKSFYGNDNYLNYFIVSRLSVVYEDLGKVNEAIDLLEGFNKNAVKPLEVKVYLDLGRLYKVSGNVEKAKQNLLYVVEKDKGSEFEKIAKLQLMELGVSPAPVTTPAKSNN